MNALIDTARDKLARMARNAYPYPDDDISGDPARRQSGLRAGRGGGSVRRAARYRGGQRHGAAAAAPAQRRHGRDEMIKSVFVANPKLARDNLRFRSGTKVYTLRSFLSAQAIRARNSMDDIDYCSSNNSTVCAVQSISAPVLFAAMGAHYFIRDNERHYDMARSKDKDFIVIEGAVHGFTHAPLRAHPRPIFQQREEPVRLRGELDQRAVLIFHRRLPVIDVYT